jgi:hypothetical protein
VARRVWQSKEEEEGKFGGAYGSWSSYGMRTPVARIL